MFTQHPTFCCGKGRRKKSIVHILNKSVIFLAETSHVWTAACRSRQVHIAIGGGLAGVRDQWGRQGCPDSMLEHSVDAVMVQGSAKVGEKRKVSWMKKEDKSKDASVGSTGSLWGDESASVMEPCSGRAAPKKQNDRARLEGDER